MLWEIINVYNHSESGRLIAYVKNEDRRCLRSYPRVIMENKLGRYLRDDEDVHHIDGDKSNNSEDNFAIVRRGEHQRFHSTKNHYHDTMATCQSCGQTFIWTANRQNRYYRDLRLGIPRWITCSKSCSSRIGRYNQLDKNK